jgi:predicted peptidase
MKYLISAITLLFINTSCIGQKKDTNDTFDFTKNIISVEQTQKLKDIRNSYGAITGLDSLYEDRTHSNGLPYHIYVPQNLKSDKAYPLVIFLHGYSDLSIDTHKGFPKGVWSLPFVQEKHPHILLVPRYRTFDDMWVQDNYRKMVIEAIDDLIAEYNQNEETPNIDVNRLYLTGFSQGGMGTWKFIENYPNKFAAAAPLSGFFEGPQNTEEAEKIKHNPIWIFNGDSDKGVKGSRLSYEMLVRAKASNVLYHEYKNQGHVIDDFAYFTEGFMDWLFSQNLKNK